MTGTGGLVNSLKDKAAIVGIGETEFSRDSGRSELQLACEAIKNACDDAGVSIQDIDGIFRYEMDSNTETMLVSALGIKNLRHWECISFGGGAANAVVGHAALALAAGQCTLAVCFRAANLRSGLRLGQSRAPERPVDQRAFSAPFGALAPAHHYGMLARRHMYMYGTTSRHFGWVAVTLRHHASRNPRAIRREPIDIEDHQNSRIIADPLRLLDFCQENDGAAAIVMTSTDRAKNLQQPPVLVEAAIQGSGPMNEGVVYRPDLNHTEAVNTAKDIWALSGSAPEEIDALMVYDHFTPFVIMALEDYGFVRPGEGKDFVEDGRNIHFDGVLPVNTHGGNHSEAYVHGLTHVQEAARLIRGTSTSQPPKKQINRVLSCSATAQLSAAAILRRA